MHANCQVTSFFRLLPSFIKNNLDFSIQHTSRELREKKMKDKFLFLLHQAEWHTTFDSNTIFSLL